MRAEVGLGHCLPPRLSNQAASTCANGTGSAAPPKLGWDYLEAPHRSEGVNFGGSGIQLTRGLRAFKLWLSLKVFGLASFHESVEHGFDLAERAGHTIRSIPGWAVVMTARLGIVTLRYAPDGLCGAEADALNRRALGRMREDVFASRVLRRCSGPSLLPTHGPYRPCASG